MKKIIIKTQSDLDALPAKFDEYTVIKIESSTKIIVSSARGNSSVEARGNSSVEARENSSVEAWENSSVEAWENSSVEARENSSVVARGNSSVEAWENSSVEAWENSSVEAWGNSSVEARGNSSVVARENSSVVARGNSSVEAWGNSSVEAWENSGVHHYSDQVVLLFGFSVAWLFRTAKAKKKSNTATIIEPKYQDGVDGWSAKEGIDSTNGSVTLFKRVSKDFKTQEGTSNETLWAIGKKLSHPSPNLKEQECGEGKYHFCSRPYFCDEFRSGKGDRYIALNVPVAQLYAWPNPSYPHKIGGTEATVLYECNKLGKRFDQRP